MTTTDVTTAAEAGKKKATLQFDFKQKNSTGVQITFPALGIPMIDVEGHSKRILLKIQAQEKAQLVIHLLPCEKKPTRTITTIS